MYYVYRYNMHVYDIHNVRSVKSNHARIRFLVGLRSGERGRRRKVFRNRQKLRSWGGGGGHQPGSKDKRPFLQTTEGKERGVGG